MSRISPRLQQYNNQESYSMGKEAAKFLIGQLFARQITPAEFEKQFGTVEKYLCWYEIQNDLPNSFITDGEELCELLKMISPSGAEDYKKECLKRLVEAKKIKEERDRQYALEDAMAAANASETATTSETTSETTNDVVVPPTPPPTPAVKPKRKTATKSATITSTTSVTANDVVVSPTPQPTPPAVKPKRKPASKKKKE